MGAAYSQDLRDRVIQAKDQGHGTKTVAERFSVSASWVRRVMQRRREHGETRPRPCGGATVVKIDPQRLRTLVEQHPDATVVELHGMLGIDCSLSAVDAALRRQGLTFKKRHSWRRSRTGRMSGNAARTGGPGSPGPTPAG